MKIYISVVSHRHAKLINDLSCLTSLSEFFTVVVKSNVSGDFFDEKLLGSVNFHWINENYGLGFGHNNNVNYKYCRDELGINSGDYFVILNPDVVIKPEAIKQLVDLMIEGNANIAAINLYKDLEREIYDHSIRNFPTIKDFISSFLDKGNASIIDKKYITASCDVDWAAGSFMVIKADHYQALGGFDEGYFMYCEDIDICYRSALEGSRVKYFPNIVALHLAKHANRKILSRHFYWHVSSVFRFLLTRLGLTKPHTSL
ncbi:glycosyltransferase family 2 protein [Vibrio fluvialis]|nr:glycosyltransferase family 2 protein [Vibrio fluvialis]MBY8300783.1 glycosyltransferase family 2 protein [Vibrio fluvialis]